MLFFVVNGVSNAKEKTEYKKTKCGLDARTALLSEVTLR